MAVCRVIDTGNMVPLVRRDQPHGARDTVANLCLEASRVISELVQDNRAVILGRDTVKQQIEYLLNVMEQLCKQVSSTEFQVRNGQFFNRINYIPPMMC